MVGCTGIKSYEEILTREKTKHGELPECCTLWTVAGLSRGNGGMAVLFFSLQPGVVFFCFDASGGFGFGAFFGACGLLARLLLLMAQRTLGAARLLTANGLGAVWVDGGG